MKVKTNEVLNVKYTARNTPKSIILVLFTLLFIMLPLSVMRDSSEKSPKIISLVSGLKNSTEVKKCNIFCGKWIHYPEGPYYDNKSCHWIIDQQNCMKFGRTDSEFLHWRWKPDECELPLFDATQFLNVVKGKKMVFVGDSVGRNQMQSLLCLLSHVFEPEDISLKYTTDETYFRRFYYTEYNFTLANLWSPYFVKSSEDNMNDHSYDSIMKLYLDEADKAWTSQVEDFDIVIISAGHWFFRPLLFYENKQLVGCNKCGKENVTELGHYYGYKKAFRTAFRTLINLRRFKGVTYFRTFSPSHFENGDWNKGGNCIRTKPFSNEEMKLDGYVLETYLTQVKEFKAAQKVATKKGLKFNMLDTTEIMLLRPDGHPNNFGHAKDKNVTFNDCVHWCLPGPIDTWNEFLFYMLKLGQKSGSKVQRIF